jgi:hypothetical protein
VLGIVFQRQGGKEQLLLCALCLLLLASCSFPGSVKPTVKIGLSAPFEGLHRDLGYEALFAVRLAVRQRNEAGGIGGRYLVEMVALNDFNEAEEAVRRAREMAVDPDVFGVLGGWSPEIAQAAIAAYERLELAYLVPETDFTHPVEMYVPMEGEVAAEYQVLSGGAPPGPVAAWTFAEANRLLDALDDTSRSEGWLTRAGVLTALTP